MTKKMATTSPPLSPTPSVTPSLAAVNGSGMLLIDLLELYSSDYANCSPYKANPDYKGKWFAPLIPNPAYKGPWAPRKISNPAYFEDKTPVKSLPKIVNCSSAFLLNKF